jgi:hypothetical protein
VVAELGEVGHSAIHHGLQGICVLGSFGSLQFLGSLLKIGAAIGQFVVGIDGPNLNVLLFPFFSVIGSCVRQGVIPRSVVDVFSQRFLQPVVFVERVASCSDRNGAIGAGLAASKLE